MGNLRYDFTDRTVVVTGAALGIGLEVARFFVAAGASTYLVDLPGDDLTAATADVGGQALPADVTSTAEVDRAIAGVITETGRIDILVNNAGMLRAHVVW